jgi:hypothetical protein
MILITKPAREPVALTAGIAETRANVALYDADPQGYTAGTVSFNIKSAIYGPKAVKNALKIAQHRKCCFCEAVFDANYAGDVEH